MRLFIFIVFCNFIAFAIQKPEDQFDPSEEVTGQQCATSRRNNNNPTGQYPFVNQVTPPNEANQPLVNILPPTNKTSPHVDEERYIPNPLLNNNVDLLETVRKQPNNVADVENEQPVENLSNCKSESGPETIEPGHRRSAGLDDDNQNAYKFKDDIGDLFLRTSNNPSKSLDTTQADDQDSLDRSVSEDEQSRRGFPIADPAYGQVSMENARPLLMAGDRVCYACSTVNNPKCWTPDRSTTVKYCRKGNDACITKSFGKGPSYTLIRDCGNTCKETEIEGFLPKYKSCSICHNDLCNSAYSINSYNILYSIIFFGIIKYTF